MLGSLRKHRPVQRLRILKFGDGDFEHFLRSLQVVEINHAPRGVLQDKRRTVARFSLTLDRGRPPVTRPLEPLQRSFMVVGGVVAVSEVIRDIAEQNLLHGLFLQSYLVHPLVQVIAFSALPRLSARLAWWDMIVAFRSSFRGPFSSVSTATKLTSHKLSRSVNALAS